MYRLEEIKQNMESCTDWYVDNSEFLGDMKWLIQRLEIAQKSLESANEILSRISSKDLKNGTLRYEAATIIQSALQQLKE